MAAAQVQRIALFKLIYLASYKSKGLLFAQEAFSMGINGDILRFIIIEKKGNFIKLHKRVSDDE
jgi:hypothetical protein